MAIEPEPFCLLETTEETLAFFAKLFEAAAERFTGTAPAFRDPHFGRQGQIFFDGDYAPTFNLWLDGDVAPIWGRTGFDRFGRMGGEASSYIRIIGPYPFWDRDSENCNDNCHGFGAAHRVGWNAVLCDGSVRTLHYAHDLGVLQFFAGIDDQQPAVLD